MMQPPQPLPPMAALLANGEAKLPHREHAPAPPHLGEAIRTELKKIVDDPKLESRLGELGRLANQADDLIACVRSPEAVMLGEHKHFGGYGGIVPAVMPNNAETYGAQMMRQIMAALESYQKAQRDTPERLTEALVVARREGMTDVVAALEKKLLGAELEGEKPVNKPPTMQDYLDKVDSEQPKVGFGG